MRFLIPMRGNGGARFVAQPMIHEHGRVVVGLGVAKQADYERISELERELHIGQYEHPYGTDPEGLTDEVRVEMERAYRGDDGMGWMPPLVERMRDAEIEARKRWPHFFEDV
jgi:hypothetical protein